MIAGIVFLLELIAQATAHILVKIITYRVSAPIKCTDNSEAFLIHVTSPALLRL